MKNLKQKTNILFLLLFIFTLTTSVQSAFTNEQTFYNASILMDAIDIEYNSSNSYLLLKYVNSTDLDTYYRYLDLNTGVEIKSIFPVNIDDKTHGIFVYNTSKKYVIDNDGYVFTSTDLINGVLNNNYSFYNFYITSTYYRPVFESKIGNTFYRANGTYLKVYNLTTDTLLYSANYDNSLLNFGICENSTDFIHKMGYDYDNNHLYFGCGQSEKLFYIKQDFYNTHNIYTNNKIDNEKVYLYADKQQDGYKNMAFLTGYPFIIKNNTIYMLNNYGGTSPNNIITKADIIDDYIGLSCNLDNTYCIDKNAVCFDDNFHTTDGVGTQLCNNAEYYNGVYCLTSQALNVCSGGCQVINLTNAYGVNYESGLCLQSDCVNDCNILGLVYSDTLSSYQRCGFYDTDGCLEWSGSIPCASNELSYNGVCQVVNTSINYIEKLNFGVNPYLQKYVPNVLPLVVNEDIWNVSYNPQTQQIDVITTTGFGGTGKFPLYIQIPYPETDYYVGFDCNYKSTIKNESLVYTGTMKGLPVRKIGTDTVFVEDFIINGLPVNKEKIIIIDDSSLSSYEFKVYTYDVNNKKINELYFVINHLTGEITCYDTVKGGTVLFTYSYTVGIQIGKIEIDIYSDFSRLTQNVMISVYRYVDANNQPLLFTRGVGTLPYKDSLATTPYKITLERKAGEIYVNNVIYEQIQSSVYGFSQLIYGSGTDYINRYEITPCVYATDGCYTARFYLSERLGGQFFSYEDLKICKNTITATTQEELDEGLSAEAKLVIALIVSGLFLLVALVLGFTSDSVIITNFAVFGGTFFSVGLMIYFAVIDWVPFWLLGVMFLLASLTIMLLFKKVVGGGDN